MRAVQALAPLGAVERGVGVGEHLLAPGLEPRVVLLGEPEHVGEHHAG